MAGAIVSSLVGPIMEKLSSQVLQQAGLIWSLETDLENLASTLSTIQAVLHDAEEKQWKSEAVKNWLRKLKDVAYDADDVLDELEIETQFHRLQQDVRSRVKSFFSLDHNPLIFRVWMALSLKNVREKMDVVANDINKFGLIARDGGDPVVNSYDWRLTSSLVNESEICGRDKEKEDLINMLLSTSDNDLSIYAISGMGGIGKTTLAQLICNDGRIKGHFDLQIWVCVSVEFDVKRLTKTIIESIEGTSPNIQELDTLQRHLQKKLLGKRFLVILDDVWDVYDDRWNKLKEVFRYGAAGSAIIITTRIEMVASRMATSFVHHMGRLSEKHSWLLFQRLALGMRRQEECACLEAIGKSIVKKCGRVPLAIKALGNLMRSKETEDEWLAVEKSEIWDLKEEGSMILPALRLSYDNLSPYLKQCFAFCSIFPKDHVLVKEQLIALWMANGFISCRGRMDLHEAGHGIFNELVGRSFFQEVKDDGIGNITCKMHDLIHDLAQSIAEQECCCLMKGDGQLKISKTTSHIAIYDRSLTPEEKLLKALSLRSFVKPYQYGRSYRGVLSGQKQLRALGVLGISSYSSLEFIGKLKHLRHLDLSHSCMETLPESITSLQKLQTLNLQDCSYLHKLPKGMRKMKSLMYLDIRGCNALCGMPVGMGELSCLRKLSIFIVGKEDGRHINELEKLNLGGQLSIKDLDFVKSSTDAKKANLMGKMNLRSLSLSWRRVEDIGVEEVLCGLQPHKNLKKLVIDGYAGSSFPNWMVDLNLQLPNLVEMELRRCCNCQQLGSFGKLQFLKHLKIYEMNSVKYLENDVFGDSGDQENHLFPILETLHFESMISLEKWLAVGGGSQSFPRLKEVTIVRCPSLVELPILPSVENLIIGGDCTDGLLRSVKNLTSLIKLRIGVISNLMHLPDGMLQNQMFLELLIIHQMKNLKSLSDQIFDNLSALRILSIWGCDKLENLQEECLHNLNSLEGLEISNCDQLKSLPNLFGLSSLRSLDVQVNPNLMCLPESIQHLTSLRWPTIIRCERLSSLPNEIGSLTSLSKLYIMDCPNLMFLPDSIQHLTSLQYLVILNCKRLSSLSNKIGSLTSLSELEISKCPNLSSLPDGMRNLNMLNTLIIEDCLNLKRRCKKDRGEDWPKIAHIPNIVIKHR